LKLFNGNYLFQEILLRINQWNEENNLGIVFGATKLNDLKDNLELIKKFPVLIPGVGTQGGNLSEIVTLFKNVNLNKFLIKSSRQILYKDNTKNFGISAKTEVEKLNSQIIEIFNS
jgi:orotidine-5'-phosphate decarboxylase